MKTFKRVLCILLCITSIMSSLSLSAFTTSAETEEVPKEAVNYNGHAYMLYDDSLSWPKAKIFCENLGGHLVTINSQEEQNFLIDLAKSSTKKNLWIGAKTDSSGIYTWVTEEEFSYTNWAPGEPNNVNNSQFTAMMYTQKADYDAGLWNDENEIGRNWPGYALTDFGFVCEWESITIIGKDETPFDLTTDSYSFPNSYGAFNYNIFSKIPLEAYYAVYGEKGKQIRKSSSTWGGSCLGMSATSALFNDDILKLKDYINNPINLNVSAYSGTKKKLLNAEHYNYIDKNQEIKKLIDQYQIWQSSKDGKAWQKKIIWQAASAEKNQISGNLRNVLKYYDNYIVALWWSKGGHAVVIDSAREPLYMGDGWYRLYIYDPNNPYFEYFDGRKADSCYNYSQSRYIDVNIFTNHWKVDLGVDGSNSSVRIGYDDKDNYISGCEIDIHVPSLLPTSFDGTAEWYYAEDSKNTLNLCCENATIYDSNGDILFQIIENETVYIDDNIVVETSVGALNEEAITSCRLELPVDEFTIEFDSEGTAQVFNEEYCYGLVSDAEGSATITTSNGVAINGEDNSAVDVVVEHINDDDTFTSVNIIVENDGQNTSYISLDENNELKVDNVEDQFNAKIYWSGQENEYLIQNVTESAVESKDIAEYALSTGELVANDIIDADITCQDVFIYDGTVKTIAPVLKYQGKTLSLGVDYYIEGNTSETDIGTYSVTVVGQGNYCGSFDITFEIIPGITFASTSLTLQHDLVLNCAVDKALFDTVGYINPYVVFEIGGKKLTFKSYSVEDEQYVFSLNDIGPNQMTDTIQATLYATYDGVEYFSETKEYSVIEGYSVDYAFLLLKYIDDHDVGLTDEQADINGDGKVTVFDAVRFLQILNSTPIK